eukprot:GSMAST32.ASY1.ANO1.54.1 assembled CDS
MKAKKKKIEILYLTILIFEIFFIIHEYDIDVTPKLNIVEVVPPPVRAAGMYVLFFFL